MEWVNAGLLTRLEVVERNLERGSADELLSGVSDSPCV